MWEINSGDRIWQWDMGSEVWEAKKTSADLEEKRKIIDYNLIECFQLTPAAKKIDKNFKAFSLQRWQPESDIIVCIHSFFDTFGTQLSQIFSASSRKNDSWILPNHMENCEKHYLLENGEILSKTVYEEHGTASKTQWIKKTRQQRIVFSLADYGKYHFWVCSQQIW